MRDKLERDDDLAVALALADQADAVTLARFGAVDLRVDTKPDLTPVSDADRAVETACGRRWREPGPTTASSVKSSAGQPLCRPAVDHRPDRRHQELRPRACRCGPA